MSDQYVPGDQREESQPEPDRINLELVPAPPQPQPQATVDVLRGYRVEHVRRQVQSVLNEILALHAMVWSEAEVAQAVVDRLCRRYPGARLPPPGEGSQESD